MYLDDYLDEYIASLQECFAKQDPVEEMQRIASLTDADKACNAMVCICQEQASLLNVAGFVSYIAWLVRTLDCFAVQRHHQLEQDVEKIEEESGNNVAMQF